MIEIIKTLFIIAMLFITVYTLLKPLRIHIEKGVPYKYVNRKMFIDVMCFRAVSIYGLIYAVKALFSLEWITSFIKAVIMLKNNLNGLDVSSILWIVAGTIYLCYNKKIGENIGKVINSIFIGIALAALIFPTFYLTIRILSIYGIVLIK